jgi:hypothetical protein
VLRYGTAAGAGHIKLALAIQGLADDLVASAVMRATGASDGGTGAINRPLASRGRRSTLMERAGAGVAAILVDANSLVRPRRRGIA